MNIYSEITSKLNSIRQMNYSGFVYEKIEEEKDLYSLVHLIWKAKNSVLEELKNRNGINFLHLGEPSKSAINYCSLFSKSTVYLIGELHDYTSYDNMTHEEFGISSDLKMAINSFENLRKKGLGFVLPERIKHRNYGEWKDNVIDLKELKNIKLKTPNHNKTTIQIIDKASDYFKIPIPIIECNDTNVILDLRQEFENDFNNFQEELLKLIDKEPEEIESQDVKKAIEIVSNRLIQISNNNFESVKKLRAKGIEVHLKFILASLLTVVPFPGSLISMIVSMPTVKDLGKWYKHWAEKENLKLEEKESIQFLWKVNERLK